MGEVRLAPTVLGGAIVATVDDHATDAGITMLRRGGSAVDAAIAANAVLAVMHPHMCGPGGDLFALVHGPSTDGVRCLSAAGRAGSGADLSTLRREGHTSMPRTGDVRAATIPGCVDGWVALHDAFGRVPFADLFEPAVSLARDGFPAPPLLALLLSLLDVGADGDLAGPAPAAGGVVRAPALAATLEAIGAGGREVFYEGRFGEAYVTMGADATASDLAQVQARWVDPVSVPVWGHVVWTAPPPSQGYLTLAGAAIAERAGPHVGEPEGAAWPHVLVEAVTAAGRSRREDLHEGADPHALLRGDRLDALAATIDLERPAAAGGPPVRDGDTTYLCAVDGDGLAVSLIQSLAGPFGCQLAAPGTGVWLQNRGLGFSLDPGHPAAFGPGRTPPHTLSPALVTHADGSFRCVIGTQGGDQQPFTVSQVLARLLVAGQAPGDAVTAARVHPQKSGGVGFDLWEAADPHLLLVERHAPEAWAGGLAARGHRVRVVDGFDESFGTCQLIERRADGTLAGAADPRSTTAYAASR